MVADGEQCKRWCGGCGSLLFNLLPRYIHSTIKRFLFSVVINLKFYPKSTILTVYFRLKGSGLELVLESTLQIILPGNPLQMGAWPKHHGPSTMYLILHNHSITITLL